MFRTFMFWFFNRLPKCCIDEGIGHPQSGALYIAVRKFPDVLEDDIRFNAVNDRQCVVKPQPEGRRQQRCQWFYGVSENPHPMPTPIRYFFQKACPLKRFLLECQLGRGAQLWFELLETWERLHEKFVDPLAPVWVVRSEHSHRSK